MAALKGPLNYVPYNIFVLLSVYHHIPFTPSVSQQQFCSQCSSNVISPHSHPSLEACRLLFGSRHAYLGLIVQSSEAIILSFLHHVFFSSPVRLHLGARFGRQTGSIFLHAQIRLRGLYHQLVSSGPCFVILQGLQFPIFQVSPRKFDQAGSLQLVPRAENYLGASAPAKSPLRHYR